jgi:hypothetical protein
VTENKIELFLQPKMKYPCCPEGLPAETSVQAGIPWGLAMGYRMEKLFRTKVRGIKPSSARWRI